MPKKAKAAKGGFFLGHKIGRAITYIVLVILAVYTLMPIVFLAVNSFKGQAEIVRNPLALPSVFTAKYIQNAFQTIHFFQSVRYTLWITVAAVTLIVFVSAFAGWVLVRHKSKISNFLFLMFVSAMLIPFQAVMFPLMNMMDKMGLKNILGLIIMYGGFGLSMSIFLYHGFMKSVPKGVEEAALIDGANIFQIFFQVVFPLLKSTTVTVIILNVMWIWNDYLLPFLTIGTSDSKTLTLELYYAKMTSGQFGNPWELIFPAVLISIIPIIIVFLSLQKYFVRGVSDGAIKA